MNWLWPLFVACTVVCWGAYGPTLHKGQAALDNNPWKAILCVGVAYFVLAVIVPIVILVVGGEKLDFNREGIKYAGIAGALGALGAIGIAAALKTGGQPLLVMPLVFGCAPLVNIATSALFHRPKESPSPYLYLGILLLAAGAVLVLVNKPK